MPIFVGGIYGEQNIPFVSVTVCIPGTSDCQTIDHIELDTGSTGLRIFSSALKGLSLPNEIDSSGKAVAECMAYGSGSNFWGPVVLADVELGSQKAKNVPIQTWNNGYSGVPSTCSGNQFTPATWGSNGTLGISPALTDCAGSSCPQTNTEPYFACDSTSCAPETLNSNQWVQNPVSLLTTDNNGLVISFPPVSPQGQSSIQGTLYFGVSTETNNIPPAQITAFKTTYDGWFHAFMNGNQYWSKFDTGTDSWNLPDGTGFSLCTQSGARNHYLCPTQKAPAVASIDIGTSTVKNISFDIGDDETELKNGIYASDDIGQDWGGGMSKDLIFGMPFFYGKSVYFVFDGKASPLGTGPINGF